MKFQNVETSVSNMKIEIDFENFKI